MLLSIQFLKMGERLEEGFLQRRNSKSQKEHEKKCSTSLVIKEKQTKVTREHFIPTP
jgi:hypothetical protein